MCLSLDLFTCWSLTVILPLTLLVPNVMEKRKFHPTPIYLNNCTGLINFISLLYIFALAAAVVDISLFVSLRKNFRARNQFIII